MNRTIPLVASSVVEPFVNALERAGLDPVPVLNQAELPSIEDRTAGSLVPLRKVTTFLDACADVTGNHRFCSDVGASLDPSGWPMLRSALDGARSLAEFISIYVVGANGMSSTIEAYFETRGEYSVFGQRRPRKPDLRPVQNDAFMAGLFLAIVERQSGKAFCARETAVAVCDPSAVTQKYKGCQLIRSGDTNHYVQFPTRWLMLGSAGSGDIPHRLMPPEKDFLSILRFQLKYECRSRVLKAADVAKLCSLSQSKLKRRLAHLNTDVSQELTRARLELAQEQLLASDASVSGLARMLGYSNAANFARWFRVNTGKSPTQYRQSLGRQEEQKRCS